MCFSEDGSRCDRAVFAVTFDDAVEREVLVRFEAIAVDEQGRKNGAGQVYIFELNTRYDLDGNFDYNDARLINHCCKPNCEAVDYRGQIWIVSTRKIKRGEELLFNYGYDIEFFMDHPCRCGADNCVGYIVRRDQWTKLKKILKRMREKRGVESSAASASPEGSG